MATMEKWTDGQLAHLVLRLALGVNIALHGIGRLPHLQTFAAGIVHDFAGTPLPALLVLPVGYAIPVVEAVVGLMVLLGIKPRAALVAGGLFMVVLTFGTCVRQEWNIAGLQLTYSLVYFVLQARASDARACIVK